MIATETVGFNTEIMGTMDEGDEARSIPKLGASRKDRANKLNKGESTPGFGRCHTIDGSINARPKGSRRTRKPELSSSTSSQRSSRMGRSTSPTAKPSSELLLKRSQTTEGSGPLRARDKYRGRLGDLADRSSRSPSPTRSPSQGHSDSEEGNIKGLPPKVPSAGGQGRGVARRSSARRPPKGRRKEMERSKTMQSLPQRRTIEALRNKSARRSGLRKSKSLDESTAPLMNINMSLRRARREMNGGALTSSGRKLESNRSNFLDSDGNDFLDTDVSMEARSKDISISASDRSGRRVNKGRNHDISRSQLARGLALQDQRVQEEEEEEARRSRRQQKIQNSIRKPKSRSRSPRRQQEQEPSSRTSLIIPKLAAPKLVVPTFEAPKLMTDTAVAASQAAYQTANAASQATYQAATAASQTATAAAAAASATANRMAVGSAAAATTAANVMSEAATRAAAALAFQSTPQATTTNTPPIMAMAPKRQKSTVSDRELASRFNHNRKAGSFTKAGSSALTNSNRSLSPGKEARSEEFTSGNGLQLF